MAKFKKGEGGRPAGVPNKSTIKAKEAFQMAFDSLGGIEAMVKWAKSDADNLKVFYGLYARLIPTDITTGDKPLEPQSYTIIREIMPAKS